MNGIYKPTSVKKREESSMKKKVIIPLLTLFIFMITTTCVFRNTIENQVNLEKQNINLIENEAPDLDIERVGIVEQSQETDNLLEKFAPYQDIIDKINKKFNTDVIGIADDRMLKYAGKTREDVYKDTIGRDLDEFENSLRNDYIEAQKSLAEININSDGKRRSLDNNLQYDKVPEYITFQEENNENEPKKIQLLHLGILNLQNSTIN